MTHFRVVAWVVAVIGLSPLAPAEPGASPTPPARLSNLSIWDDGLSEMSYFAASDRIYGTERRYTRVQLVNRQWMHGTTGVKVEPGDPAAVPVFKMNISEEIPTENYQYRYLVSVFLKRPDLLPFKLAASSQEWCGTTYKSLRWNDEGLTIKSFSYFDGEGDRTWTLAGDVVPYEALPLLARDVAVNRITRHLSVLSPVRTNHEAHDSRLPARLIAGGTATVTVPAGRFDTIRINLEWDGPETHFDVATEPPYTLIRYQIENGRGDLSLVERRPYWDRTSRSAFYPVHRAP